MSKKTAMILVVVALISGLGWVWTTHQALGVAAVVVALCAALGFVSARVLS